MSQGALEGSRFLLNPLTSATCMANEEKGKIDSNLIRKSGRQAQYKRNFSIEQNERKKKHFGRS
jgi:hypothetical protein